MARGQISQQASIYAENFASNFLRCPNQSAKYAHAREWFENGVKAGIAYGRVTPGGLWPAEDRERALLLLGDLEEGFNGEP
jgi:hypothetical protein